MSVVQADRRRRWFLVAVGTAAVFGVPASWSRARDAVAVGGRRPTGAGSGQQLLRRAVGSAGVRHEGLVESRGGIALPDLPRLGQVGALVGGTVQARVWWSSSSRWRVDTLTTTGEQGVYGIGDESVTWDYEANTLVSERAGTGLRLPRVDDLLPPQAARRLLAGVGGSDRVQVQPRTSRVAGCEARGLRVVPGDPRATVSGLEVWADGRTGLPLSVTLRGPGGEAALTTRFLEVAYRNPADAVLALPAAPSAWRQTRTRPDLVQEIERTTGRRMPDRLAGFPRSPTDEAGGTVMYGDGLARFVVLPLPPGLGAQMLDAARTGGAALAQVTGGSLAELHSGVLSTIAAQGSDGEHTYLVSGPIRADALRDAAGELLTRPPARRR